MNFKRVTMPLSAISVTLCGCMGVPSFDMETVGTGTAEKPVTVEQIIDRIQCEVFIASEKFDKLKSEKYVGAATLTLEVNDKAALTPSLSFIDPFATAGTNFTIGVGGELSKARKRTFQQSFNVVVSAIDGHGCATSTSPDSNLAGELGIVELVGLGLNSTDKSDAAINYGDAKDQFLGPVFGSTIAFTVVKAGSVGPQWSLRTFKGPSAGAGLGALTRNDIHTLLISFAPPKGSKTAFEANRSAGIASAAQSARENNVDMRLYSIAR